MFAVIYRGYVKHGRDKEYKRAWCEIATHFVNECGALSSSLHKTRDGVWIAYSRWPDRATRDAVWPSKEGICSRQLPGHICEAINQIHDCLDEQLPEITMDLLYEVDSKGVHVCE